MVTRFSFHPIVDRAYQSVHAWLEQQLEGRSYREIGKTEAGRLLHETSLKSAAAQFNVFFPAHFFKTAYVFQNGITYDRIADWIYNNPCICVIDVGCGAGTASAAFVEAILRLLETRTAIELEQNLEIFCLGIDINPYAIAVFNQMMLHLQRELDTSSVHLTYDYLCQGIPQAILPSIRRLEKKLKDDWHQPRIAHAIVAQVNLVSPLTSAHYRNAENMETLHRLGVQIHTDDDGFAEFGRPEALTYEQLLTHASIDNCHVITIGTTGEDEGGYLLGQRVQEMARIIENVFEEKRAGHSVETVISECDTVWYDNPPNCYWSEYGRRSHYSRFYWGVNHIRSASLAKDTRWQKILDAQNLKLAWARARHNLTNEAFYDETELRIFEQNLDRSIGRLQRQLANYADSLFQDQDRIPYGATKNAEVNRPRGLTRLEEEIVVVAIIQSAGASIPNLSYAYRVSDGSQARSRNEYLYGSWFRAHEQFTREARQGAQEFPDGAVLQVDIARFFEKTIQQRLADIAIGELSGGSERIQWLVENLVVKELDNHLPGRGLSQGSIGSGFFANLYLSALDVAFTSNPWDARLYRYVDDIIIVLPDRDDVNQVLDLINEILEERGLELNVQKTKFFERVEDFLEATRLDELVDNLSKTFKSLSHLLWIMDSRYRSAFIGAHRRGGDEWWDLVRNFQMCLHALGMFISVNELSRRIYGYLFNERRRNNQLGQQHELRLPVMPVIPNPDAFGAWADEFRQNNHEWLENLKQLRHMLYETFKETLSTHSEDLDSRQETRLRFVTNRLCLLGLAPIGDSIVEILCDRPWLLRDPSNVIESLTLSRCDGQLFQLIGYYRLVETNIAAEYMRALILRALRWLQVMDDDVEELLFEYAINPAATVPERLMASESILFRRYSSTGFSLNETRKQRIIDALATADLASNRLRKNYMLLLGADTPKEILQRRFSDHMLDDVTTYIQGNPNPDLFETPEPDILREEFYSGQMIDSDGLSEYPNAGI